MEILFWSSIAFVAYVFAGYPLLIWLVGRIAPAPALKKRHDWSPRVTLCISAYNEERAIGEKIENSLALDYPPHLLDILVISDGSTDRTCEIVRAAAGRGVRLRHFAQRRGKTACLNSVVPEARGTIVIFTDANSLLAPEAVARLVRNFADETVGLVTGTTRYAEATSGRAETALGAYAALELFTKRAETRAGSCVGADGALFAIRKGLYEPLAANDINDFVIPLAIVRDGWRGVLDEAALSIEPAAGNAAGEFRRQVRITNRTLRATLKYRVLLNPFVYNRFALQLLSHKIARFVVPFCVLLLVGTSVALADTSPFYMAFDAAEAAFGLLALYRHGRRQSLLTRLAAICRTFLITQAAVLAGWFQLMRGKTYTVWSPVER